MSNTPRQLQGRSAELQDAPFGVLLGAASCDDLQAFEPAANDAPTARHPAQAAQDALAPVSNLSISSWYAISGTAMA